MDKHDLQRSRLRMLVASRTNWWLAGSLLAVLALGVGLVARPADASTDAPATISRSSAQGAPVADFALGAPTLSELQGAVAPQQVTITSITAAPPSATLVVGATHTVTATVNPVTSGVDVRFSVAAGPNSGEAAGATTDALGKATFSYVGDGGTGNDVIIAWVDVDGDDALDATEPAVAVAATWNAATATTLALTPTIDTNPTGTTHTVTATRTPIASGEVVRFRVTSGPNTGETGSGTTDAQGKATFSYVGDGGTGSDVIQAWLDANNNGVLDSGEVQTSAVKIWTTDGTATAVTVSPAADTNAVGTSHKLTASITPVAAGALVRFQVISGPSAGAAGNDATDAQGKATFSYTGTAVGNDVILVWVDLNTNGSLDGGEPQAVATASWVAATTNDGKDDHNGKKVAICHVPPGNAAAAHTIYVGREAADAHLSHGDTLGACGDGAQTIRLRLDCQFEYSGDASQISLDGLIVNLNGVTTIGGQTLTLSDCTRVSLGVRNAKDGRIRLGRHNRSDKQAGALQIACDVPASSTTGYTTIALRDCSGDWVKSWKQWLDDHDTNDGGRANRVQKVRKSWKGHGKDD